MPKRQHTPEAREKMRVRALARPKRPKKLCSIPNCLEASHAKNLCRTHYQTKRRANIYEAVQRNVVADQLKSPPVIVARQISSEAPQPEQSPPPFKYKTPEEFRAAMDVERAKRATPIEEESLQESPPVDDLFKQMASQFIQADAPYQRAAQSVREGV